MTEESGYPSPYAIDRAERLRTRTVAAGRWFSRYLVGLGFGSAIAMVLWESVFPDGLARGLAISAWCVFMLLASWWAERHAVYPAGASRCQLVASAVWFGSYLLLIGPPVRWKFDNSLLPWALAALVMSLPFFVAAGWMRRNR